MFITTQIEEQKQQLAAEKEKQQPDSNTISSLQAETEKLKNGTNTF